MEEDDLIQRIKWLHDPNGGNIELPLLADHDNVFLDLPGNRELKDRFEQSKYYKRKWQWHQLVRAVLEIDPDIKQYMYDRLTKEWFIQSIGIIKSFLIFINP